MEIKEFYQLTGGGYQEAIGRLMKDELISRFLKSFLQDDSMAKLTSGMEAKDYEAAFVGAHTLKGVTANLSLVDLNKAAVEITEMLRNGKDIEAAIGYLPQVQAEYDKVVGLIGQLA